ncbi:hypothetical protein F5880DRAFT_1509417 [Lentinula raphanica]|nr:hypothetical protein F5880DRAFT_1509417 [Lentinula raphanica]
MYLFRIIFRRRSLAVHVFLLSMIAAVIALPTSKSNPRKRPWIEGSEASTGQAGSPGQYSVFSAVSGEVIAQYEFAAIMSGQKWSDPTAAQWVMMIIPSVYLTPTNRNKKLWPQAFGYRTIQDPNSSAWTRQLAAGKKKVVTGASVAVNPARLRYTIAKLRMSQETKLQLTLAMKAVVDENHTDKLPNIPSGYQYALLLEKQLKKPDFEHTVEVVSFDMSETSEYGKVFTEMITNKCLGGGKVLNKETDRWEWELYGQIEHYGPTNILEKSLDSRNRYLLKGSWDKLHGTGLPATSPQNLLLPATSSQNSPLPGTSPQNSPHPATSSQHSTLPDIWTPEHQRVVDKFFEEDPKFWSEELDRPSHPSGHR